MWHCSQPCFYTAQISDACSMQRRLTFQWDLWSGRPLDSLVAMEMATCRFLLSAAVVLASSNTHALKEAEYRHTLPAAFLPLCLAYVSCGVAMALLTVLSVRLAAPHLVSKLASEHTSVLRALDHISEPRLPFPCREIVIEINPCNVPEPRVLHGIRSDFNAVLAAAVQPRRLALFMGLHPRCD